MLLNSVFENVRNAWKQWRAVIIGLLLGLAYGYIGQQIDFEAAHAPKLFIWLSDFVSVILEGILGAAAGLAYNYVWKQQRLNRQLSTENAKLQRSVFTQALSAHILHEIRTPLHNTTAVLESEQGSLLPEDVAILKRNVDRLQAVTNQLSRWTVFDSEIDLREPTLLSRWLDEFITDKVRPRLHRANIHLESHLDPVVVQMHPSLLEQCCTTLLNNAMEATTRGHKPYVMRITATASVEHPGYVEVRLENTGERYPEAVLATQGREPVTSQHGLGLGLVLARRSLELVGGSIELANLEGQARTTCWIPGRQST